MGAFTCKDPGTMACQMDPEVAHETLLQRPGWRAHLATRCSCEWAIIRRRIFPEWIGLLVCVTYINKVVRYLGFVRHRQLVDYIPQDWCTAIASSPDKPAGWSGSCVDNAAQLVHDGALLDVLHESLPELTGDLEVIPEVLEASLTLVVFAACLYGCLSLPCEKKPRPYLSNVATRCPGACPSPLVCGPSSSLPPHCQARTASVWVPLSTPSTRKLDGQLLRL